MVDLGLAISPGTRCVLLASFGYGMHVHANPTFYRSDSCAVTEN